MQDRNTTHMCTVQTETVSRIVLLWYERNQTGRLHNLKALGQVKTLLYARTPTRKDSLKWKTLTGKGFMIRKGPMTRADSYWVGLIQNYFYVNCTYIEFPTEDTVTFSICSTCKILVWLYVIFFSQNLILSISCNVICQYLISRRFYVPVRCIPDVWDHRQKNISFSYFLPDFTGFFLILRPVKCVLFRGEKKKHR